MHSIGRQVGDGTTTVVLLAGEFLREAKMFVEDGVHPQSIIRSYREAAGLAVAKASCLYFYFSFFLSTPSPRPPPPFAPPWCSVLSDVSHPPPP